MKQLFFGTFLLVLISCDNKSTEKELLEYNDGRQLLTLNGIDINGNKFEEPKINFLTLDSPRIGEEFLVKIFLSGNDIKIANAFVDCETIENPSVDTVTYNVTGCKNGLHVHSDTIMIAFEPTSTGIKSFLK